MIFGRDTWPDVRQIIIGLQFLFTKKSNYMKVMRNLCLNDQIKTLITEKGTYYTTRKRYPFQSPC